MINWAKIILWAVLCLPFCSQAAMFKAEEFTLENGLRCVVVQNHKAPIIQHMLWYQVGSVDGINGKGGGAHLLEHLMFRGTHSVKNGEFSRLLNENGVKNNAFTDYDVTVYHELADVSRLELVMALEADRMQNLNFDEKAFKTEQKIVFEERKQVVEEDPSSIFKEKFKRAFWGNSPYGYPIIGLSEDILNLTYNDVRQFYEDFYAPNNAILVLVGDIDTQTAKTLAQKYYGKIPARPIQRNVPKSAEEKFSGILNMLLPQVKNEKMFYFYMLPKRTEVRGSLYDYLVLSEYLGGGQTSALYRRMVIANPYLVDVSADYLWQFRSNSVFILAMTLAEGNLSVSVHNFLQSEMQRLMQNFTEQDLETVKKKMLSDLVFVNDNPKDAAMVIGYMLSSGFTLEEVLDYENKINAVTLEGVKAAYTEVFENASLLRGFLAPDEREKNE